MKYKDFLFVISLILLCSTSFILFKVNENSIVLSTKNIYIIKNIWIWTMGLFMPFSMYLSNIVIKNRSNIVLLFFMVVLCILFSIGSIINFNTLKFKRAEDFLSFIILSIFVVKCVIFSLK